MNSDELLAADANLSRVEIKTGKTSNNANNNQKNKENAINDLIGFLKSLPDSPAPRVNVSRPGQDIPDGINVF